MQQGIANVDVEAQQELSDFQVLVLNGNQKGCAAERVDAVDVDLEVDLCLLTKLVGKVFTVKAYRVLLCIEANIILLLAVKYLRWWPYLALIGYTSNTLG